MTTVVNGPKVRLFTAVFVFTIIRFLVLTCLEKFGQIVQSGEGLFLMPNVFPIGTSSHFVIHHSRSALTETAANGETVACKR